ncbi:expressed protein [Phakopsora pachyrhizi]|uniref:Expressed protein n=1 Tax=Phakopsora pachyrhizi TaxID=170000 RepID=A0AAV0ANF8_PHAPC|nr:expressed protein [Phakopsora pachyrhizi]
MIFIVLLSRINCFDSPTSAELAFGLGGAQHNLHDLTDSSLRKAVIQSSKPQSTPSIQESTSSATKIAKFDLNEYPEDVDPAVENYQVKKISDLGSEKSFNQASKRQRLMPNEQHLSPQTAQYLTIMKNSCTEEISSKHLATGVEISFDHSLPAQKSKNVGPITHVECESALNPVLKPYTSEKSAKPSKLNLKFKELKNRESASASQKLANLSWEGKLIPTVDLDADTKARKTFRFLKFIKENLSEKIENSGPFDLEGERQYNSPYNKDLLQFIDQNLSKIVHDSLGNFEIDKKFLEAVKTLLWKDEEGMFYTTEKVISEVMDNVKSSYNVHTGSSWVNFSPPGHVKPSESVPAIYKLKFREVFTKVLTYENFSRFFLLIICAYSA